MKEAEINVVFNEKEKRNNYSVGDYDITEAIESMLASCQEQVDGIIRTSAILRRALENVCTKSSAKNWCEKCKASGLECSNINYCALKFQVLIDDVVKQNKSNS